MGIDVGRELRDLRRTLAQLVSGIDPAAIVSYTAIRMVRVNGTGSAEATELAPARKDRIRCRITPIDNEIDLGTSPQVAVEGGWRIVPVLLGGTPFTDDPPAASKGAWYGFAPNNPNALVAVMETIRGIPPD